jgi:hypothetical protein
VAVVGDIADANVTPIGVTGATLCVEGEQQVEFRLHNCTLRHPFYVCSLPTEMDAIVDTDLLVKLRARLYLDNRTLEIIREAGPPREPAVQRTGRQGDHKAFTIFTTFGNSAKGRVNENKQRERDCRKNQSWCCALMKFG